MNWLQLLIVRAINGTIQLGARTIRWPWQTAEGRSRLGRGVALLFGAWSFYRLTLFWPWVGPVTIAVVLCAGWWTALPVTIAEDEDATEDQVEDDDPQLTPAELRTELIATIRDLIGGARGVHLDLVHAAWIRDGHIREERSLSEFRTMVERLGIRVRSSVKVDQHTRIGVHVDDLPDADPQPAAATPPPAVPDDLLQDW